MRIGIGIDEFDPARGGASQWTWQFVSALAARGHDLHVLSRRFCPLCSTLPITCHWLDAGSRIEFAAVLEAKARVLELDLMHDMGAGWFSDIFHPHGGSLLAVHERKLDMHRPWFRLIKRHVAPLLPRRREQARLMRGQYQDRGQVWLALSQTVADDFVQRHGVSPERIKIIYNGVNTERFSPERCLPRREAMRRQLGIDDETLLLLIVAHNFRLKGVPELLRLTQRLAQAGKRVHLAVVGGKRLQRWQSSAARLELDQYVTYLGAVSDPVPYYAAADVYVHPTYFDPCSLVLLEAAACGLPIVTTRGHNGVAELLVDNASALLVNDPQDADGLYDRLTALYDERLRRTLATAARETALAHPFEKNVDEVCQLYQELAPRGKSHLRHRATAA